jgi:hypothetical protein
VPISSTNTNRGASIFWATITFQAALTNSSCSIAPTVLFSAEAHLLEEPPERRFAKALAREILQKAAPFSYGGCRTLLDVLFEELPCSLSAFGGRPPPCLGARESPWRASLT